MTPRFGHPQPLAPATRAICLWWNSVEIPERKDLRTVLQDIKNSGRDDGRALGEPGVYAFEGSHDSRPHGGILYIGQVGADCETNGAKPSRTIEVRAGESFSRFAWTEKAKRGAEPDAGLFADVWNLRLRWASVATDCIAGVERLLIVGHAPSFNSKHVRSTLSEEAGNLVVMNAGAKGMLLPVLAGKYFDASFWKTFE
jgi:hypothetical protein